MTNEVRRGRKRRRPRGIPMVLVIVLLVIALVMGGLAGFAIARSTSPDRKQLEKANARVMELENTLTLIGFSPDTDSPEDWIFDDSSKNGAGDLAGNYGQSEADVWSDDDLLSGTLNEDADPVVVAEFDGGQLLSTEVIPAFNDQLTNQLLAGYSAEEVSNTVLMTVLNQKAGEKLVALKAKEQGYDQLTEADKKAIEAEADAAYASQLNYYAAFVAQPGMTQAEINAAAAEEGALSRDDIVEELTEAWPVRKYREALVKDIAVTDEEVQAYYDELLTQQHTAYAQSAEEFEYAHTDGNLIVYRPEGYRAVRNLLIPFDDEETADKAATLLDQIDQLDPTKDADKLQALHAELDPLYAPLEAKANEIIEKLKNGASFASLLDEYGRDEAMKSEPLHSQGYYISDDSFLFSTEFIEGSMLLEKPGDVSAPLRSPSGVHLVEYTAELPAGDVPLSEVVDQVRAEALSIKQEDYYQQQTAEMLEKANVKFYPERLQ